MNSNFYLLYILLFIFGCGVKTRPQSPTNEKLPTLIDKYSYKTKTEKIKDKETKDKKKEAPKP